MSRRRIFLIRHAQSEKNVEDRHGGPGRLVTEVGHQEIVRLASFLINSGGCFPIVFYSPILQAEATAQYLSRRLSAMYHTDERIRPLNLGVLSGLSREEAMVKYPESAKRLEKWRQGNLKIEELNIPRMEDINDFWNRGCSFLSDHLLNPDEENDLVVIGTRSILILLLNILLQNTELTGKPYTVFDFQNCGVSILQYIRDLDAELVCHNKTEYLQDNHLR